MEYFLINSDSERSICNDGFSTCRRQKSPICSEFLVFSLNEKHYYFKKINEQAASFPFLYQHPKRVVLYIYVYRSILSGYSQLYYLKNNNFLRLTFWLDPKSNKKVKTSFVFLAFATVSPLKIKRCRFRFTYNILVSPNFLLL